MFFFFEGKKLYLDILVKIKVLCLQKSIVLALFPFIVGVHIVLTAISLVLHAVRKSFNILSF